jgi:SAM-dependent methyltransferase
LSEGPLRERRDCRLCGSTELERVVELTPTPPANAFTARPEPQTAYPLELMLCGGCGHLQLHHVVDPQVLFRDYVYAAGTSPVFVAHFKDYAADAIARFGLKAGDLVVDVGSNDGTLLGFFKSSGLRVLGIDPAREIARRATDAGIPTMPEFLDVPMARKIRREHGRAHLVTANNVFAHVDDLAGFVAAVRELLAPDGVFIFEVSYALDVYEKTLFDTIYHEHLDYHTVKPLVGFLERAGLPLFAAERIPTHGGSLRGMAGGGRGVDDTVRQRLAEEDEARIACATSWRAWSAKIEAVRDQLLSLLGALKAEGRSIAGYGAPAKATTLLGNFGLGAETLDFIADDSQLKQGLLTPGSHIPVLAADALYERRPDYVVVLAWNFADSIIARHARFTEAGGRFIVPLPEVRVV